MAEEKEKKKKVNLSIDLPEDIAAVIEHEAIMRAQSADEILRELVQKMFDDNSKEITQALKGS